MGRIWPSNDIESSPQSAGVLEATNAQANSKQTAKRQVRIWQCILDSARKVRQEGGWRVGKTYYGRQLGLRLRLLALTGAVLGKCRDYGWRIG